MKVWVYPERQYEELGAERWEVEWQEVKPVAAARIAASEAAGGLDEVDPDIDLVWYRRYYKRRTSAEALARKVYESGRTAFGSVTVMRQTVDWFVEEDRVAEWTDAGDAIYVD